MTNDEKTIMPDIPAFVIRHSGIRHLPSHYLAGEAHDFHELAVAELAGHRAEDPRAARVLVGVDQPHGVRIEPHVAAVLPAGGFLRPHDHGPHDRLLFDFARRQRVFHAANDDVAQPGHALAAAAEHFDAHHLFGAGVVGDIESGLHLDHGQLTAT